MGTKLLRPASSTKQYNLRSPCAHNLGLVDDPGKRGAWLGSFWQNIYLNSWKRQPIAEPRLATQHGALLVYIEAQSSRQMLIRGACSLAKHSKWLQ